MKIIMIDYGVGNLRSVKKALESVGAEVIQTDEPEVIEMGDKVVLPGVGAFQDGMLGLQQRGLISAIHQVVKRRTPLLGICLGMQVFFNQSSELGDSDGLGFINGDVKKFPVGRLKIPHTGWNQIKVRANEPLFRGVADNAYVYFNHSYYCAPVDSKVMKASTAYDVTFASAVHSGSIYGVQFHPEKSQDVGLTILRNFVEHCE